jgi:uncharacterized protein
MAIRALLLILVLALHACSSVPTSRPVAETPKAPEHQARTLLQQGDYVNAARAYLTLAASTVEPNKRGDYQITAVELFLRAKQTHEPKPVLLSLHQHSDATLRWRALFAQAEIDLLEGRGQEAAARLAAIQQTPMPLSLHGRYYLLQADILESQQQHEQAARLRALQLDPLLRNQGEREANHRALWRNLQQLTPAQLGASAENPVWQGWLALALLLKTTQPQYQLQAIESWRQRFPQHPATQMLTTGSDEARLSVTDGSLSATPGSANYPQQPGHQGFKPHIALLLPLSGNLKRHAESVRDGFMAAWYADGQRSAVRVYDSTTADLDNTYRQAIQNGAAAVVGPLDKEEVLRLLQALGGQPAPVPTLALNVLDASILNSTTMPPNFYQFSLAPEDEAIDAALWAWQDGHRSAAILTPSNEWGQRLANAFRDQWQALGGQIVDTRSYEDNFAQPVRGIVSHKSYLDMVFIAAYPVEGRRIKPQFRYYLAGGLPLYATSHIYSGIRDVSQDRDLDGVRFVEIPWRLKSMTGSDDLNQDLYPQLSRQWPDLYSNRLLAFGIDSYYLAQRLPLPNNGQIVLRGESGQLSVDRRGLIQRRLQQALFSNGLARGLNILDTAPTAQEEFLPSADQSR